MEKRIVFNQPNGVVGVIAPSPKFKQEYQFWVLNNAIRDITPVLWNDTDVSEMTADKFAEFVQWKDVPQGLESRICTVEDLPLTRTFRDGWADVKKGSQIDTVLTDELKRSHLQKMYQVELARLPVNALGKVSQADIEALEDEILALDIDAVSTLDELYNLWVARGRRTEPRKYDPFNEKLRKYLPDGDVRKK